MTTTERHPMLDGMKRGACSVLKSQLCHSAASAVPKPRYSKATLSRRSRENGSRRVPPRAFFEGIGNRIDVCKTSRRSGCFAKLVSSVSLLPRKSSQNLLFRPFLNDGRSRFPYEEWLLYFAVSLAWRCLATSGEEGLRDHPHHLDAVGRARDTWTGYLLGKSDYAGPYRFNLFFTPLGGSSDSRVPDGLSWYFMRGTDMTPVYSKALVATFIKLPGMLFWTSIVPPDPGGWKGTRIAKRGTLRQKDQGMDEGQFLMDRVDLIYKRINNLSSQQSQRITDTVRRNPERAAQSGSFKAWLDDERIRRANKLKS
jgi:hypothetical protein